MVLKTRPAFCEVLTQNPFKEVSGGAAGAIRAAVETAVAGKPALFDRWLPLFHKRNRGNIETALILFLLSHICSAFRVRARDLSTVRPPV